MHLAAEVHGEPTDPAIVLIHGITDSHEMWRPLIDSLAQSHRVLAVDLRGHGDSPDGDSYDPFSYAEDVVETVTAAGLHDVLVVGHSLGGIVASAYAAMAPCRGVLNIDQSLRLSGFKEQLKLLEPMLKGEEHAFQGAIAMMFDMLNGPLGAVETTRLNHHKRPNQQVVLGTWASVFESTAAELDATVEGLASAITVPYLAVHGTDPGPEYADWLNNLMPLSTVEVWPDMGHYPHLVDPQRFLSRLAAFETLIG